MEKQIGFEIRSLSILLKRHINASLVFKENQELTGIQTIIIDYIYKNKDRDIYQKDIESELTIRRSTATEILKLMEKNELLKKKSVKSDRRLKKLVLTEKAIEIHNQVSSSIYDVENKMRSALTDEEYEKFFLIINKLKSVIDTGR